MKVVWPPSISKRHQVPLKRSSQKTEASSLLLLLPLLPLPSHQQVLSILQSNLYDEVVNPSSSILAQTNIPGYWVFKKKKKSLFCFVFILFCLKVISLSLPPLIHLPQSRKKNQIKLTWLKIFNVFPLHLEQTQMY